MKFIHLVVLVLVCGSIACNAQKKFININQCSKGNTGHKGIIPKEDMYKPVEGKDFYAISIKVIKKCQIEVLDLIVKREEGQISLKPFFDSGNNKMVLSTGENGYIRAERDSNVASVSSKATIKGEGLLILKVNGKKVSYPIEKFEMILPQ